MQNIPADVQVHSGAWSVRARAMPVPEKILEACTRFQRRNRIALAFDEERFLDAPCPKNLADGHAAHGSQKVMLPSGTGLVLGPRSIGCSTLSRLQLRRISD